GNYEVTIVDTDNGCFSVCSKEVILDTNIPNCNGGGNYVLNCENSFSVLLNGSSTTPNVTYQWKDSEDNNITTDENGDATVTQPGLYTLVVTGPNGCTSNCAVTVTQPEELTCEITVNETVSCYGLTDGKAAVKASEGTAPYSYN